MSSNKSSARKQAKARVSKIKHLAKNIRDLKNYKISVEQEHNDRMGNLIKHIISKKLAEKKSG